MLLDVLSGLYWDIKNLILVMIIMSIPLSGLSLVLFFIRVAMLRRIGFTGPKDHVKVYFQFFISLMFITSVLYLYIAEKISLGDGIPLLISILIYAADKFLIGFRNKPYATPISKADELKKWKEHLNEGTISKADFEKQKNKILNGS